MKVYLVDDGSATYWTLMHEYTFEAFRELVRASYGDLDALDGVEPANVKATELDEAAQRERHFHDHDQDPPERWSLFEEVQKHTEPTLLGCSEW